MPSNNLYTIQGIITDSFMKPVPDLLVKAFHQKSNTSKDPVGKPANTNKKGYYKITASEDEFPIGTDVRNLNLFIEVYNTELILDTSSIVRVSGLVTNINLQVAHSKSDVCYVKGQVSDASGMGLPGLAVTVIDKNIGGGETILGSAQTEKNGFYLVLYSFRDKSKKQAPDIQIKVTDKNNKIIGTSAIRVDANAEEIINYKISKDVHKEASEYDKMIQVIAEHLDNRSIKDLKEDKDQRDISILSRKTGYDARMIAMASLAAKRSEESGVPAEYFYALYRAGMPTEDKGFQNPKLQTAEKIWVQAADKNIIDIRFKEEIQNFRNAFKAIGNAQLLRNKIGVSTLYDVLNISMPNDKHKSAFLDLYMHHTGTKTELWTKVEERFGKKVKDDLLLIGKLSLLTVNNAPLIAKMRRENLIKDDPVNLIQKGLYSNTSWESLLTDNIPVPEQIIGNSPEEKKQGYARFMAYQLRKNYPTAVLAEKINAEEIPLRNTAVKKALYDFLRQNHRSFDIGRHPIEQYLKDRNLRFSQDEEVHKNALNESKRLYRAYQVTPTDTAMASMLRIGLDSARSVTRYSEEQFIQQYSEELGGETTAKYIYVRSNHIVSTINNLSIALLEYRLNPEVYAINRSLHRAQEALTADRNFQGVHEGVIANPTLEELFGELDFCECEHCRSVLSPAAYLVDLLQFINLEKFNADGEPLPMPDVQNPLNILLGKRPDIQHIQLTCENTNTVLPYIDLVNEILEYFIVQNSGTEEFKGLDGFAGYNIPEGITTEELLANPQFVNDQAYQLINEQVYPFQLPFNQPLEVLRKYFLHLEAPFYKAMKIFRRHEGLNNLEEPTRYGWNSIYLEYLNISQQENAILTSMQDLHNSSHFLDIPAYYGKPGMPLQDFISSYSNAKTYARSTNIQYQDLIDLLKTRFINPSAILLPKLTRLNVSFDQMSALVSGSLSANDFLALLPEDLELSEYDGDVVKWIMNAFILIPNLVVLENEEGDMSDCGFENLNMQYAIPWFDNGRKPKKSLKGFEFIKLMRFIRLWKILGWDIKDIDTVFTALYPPGLLPLQTDSDEEAIKKLNNGFKALIIQIAHIKQVMERLRLTVKNLSNLLVFWSDINAYGKDSLYSRLFLNASILKKDNAFDEDSFGNILADRGKKLLAYQDTLQAAFNLSSKEFFIVTEKLSFNENTPLSLTNISAVYKYAFFAKSLKISVSELICLIKISGIQPFQPLEKIEPAIIRFIEVAYLLKESDVNIIDLDYLMTHEDHSGKASPSLRDMISFAQVLRTRLKEPESQNMILEDPSGEGFFEKLALVFGEDTAKTFFSLIKNTILFTTSFSQAEVLLANNIRGLKLRIDYNHFTKLLSFSGVMTEEERVALQGIEDVTTNFQSAVDELFNKGQLFINDYFFRHQELLVLYEHFVFSHDTDTIKYTRLLELFLPVFKQRLKRQTLVQTLSAELDQGAEIIKEVLASPSIIHANTEENSPADIDFLRLEPGGVSAKYYYADEITGVPDEERSTITGIDFHEGELPQNLINPGAAISADWKFYIAVPMTTQYNFYIETDVDASVRLIINNEEIPLIDTDGIRQNNIPILLEAGSFPLFELQLLRVRNIAVLRWERQESGRSLVDSNYLYAFDIIANFIATYLRLLKGFALLNYSNLQLPEISYFCNEGRYRTATNSFWDSLPVLVNPNLTIVHDLLECFRQMLLYRKIKERLKIKGHTLINIFNNSAETTSDGQNLLTLATGWETSEIQLLSEHFQFEPNDILAIERYIDAFAIKNLLGLSFQVVLPVINEFPSAISVRTLQTALRAKYDNQGWLQVISPLHDELRNRQRDALVSYAIHLLMSNPNTGHIDTPNKLFEYFLIDVQMDACMKTSRIKQAISSVQLFIHRCFLNLEPEVRSSGLNAKQWEWMKRYRLSEANRKVFLYPENWLEPELRDNKSSFFKELESELLQSDITDEAAELSFLHYLEKLEEVAKLEICGMCIQENEYANKEDDIIHVIARTAGAKRKYYYQRLENKVWTPWEKIALDIEDNPILPVMWNNRLFLFWLNILTRAPENQQPGMSTEGNVDTVLNDLLATPDNKVVIEASLSWSEYFNREWQPRNTSDFHNPLILGQFDPGTFERASVTLFSSFGNEGQLVINVNSSAFVLFNKNTLPQKVGSVSLNYGLARDTITDIEVKVVYSYSEPSMPGSTIISITKGDILLERPMLSSIVPSQTLGGRSIAEAPFFLQDSKNTFYVVPEGNVRKVVENDEMVIPIDVNASPLKIIENWFLQSPEDALSSPVIDPALDIVDQLATREKNPVIRGFVSTGVKFGLPVHGAVQFNGTPIGARGMIENSTPIPLVFL